MKIEQRPRRKHATIRTGRKFQIKKLKKSTGSDKGNRSSATQLCFNEKSSNIITVCNNNIITVCCSNIITVCSSNIKTVCISNIITVCSSNIPFSICRKLIARQSIISKMGHSLANQNINMWLLGN